MSVETTDRKVTSIQITEEFKAWLDTQGKKGDTYEDILRRFAKYTENTASRPDLRRDTPGTD